MGRKRVRKRRDEEERKRRSTNGKEVRKTNVRNE